MQSSVGIPSSPSPSAPPPRISLRGNLQLSSCSCGLPSGSPVSSLIIPHLITWAGGVLKDEGTLRQAGWPDRIGSNWSGRSCCTWQIEAAEVSDHPRESGWGRVRRVGPVPSQPVEGTPPCLHPARSLEASREDLGGCLSLNA